MKANSKDDAIVFLLCVITGLIIALFCAGVVLDQYQNRSSIYTCECKP